MRLGFKKVRTFTPCTLLVKKVEPTLVFDLKVGGDQWWGLTPDPRSKRFSALSFVIFDYLDLYEEREGGKNIPTFIHVCIMHMTHFPQTLTTSNRGTFNTRAVDFHTTLHTFGATKLKMNQSSSVDIL